MLLGFFVQQINWLDYLLFSHSMDVSYFIQLDLCLVWVVIVVLCFLVLIGCEG